MSIVNSPYFATLPPTILNGKVNSHVDLFQRGSHLIAILHDYSMFTVVASIVANTTFPVEEIAVDFNIDMTAIPYSRVAVAVEPSAIGAVGVVRSWSAVGI